MQLAASDKARFFIQKEYFQVEIDNHCLRLRSSKSEEVIPFSIWNGSITVSRGLVWGELQFYAHQKDNKQHAWLVQGLPWSQCKKFAYAAIQKYQDWYKAQCEQLLINLPKWEEKLERIERLPAFLPHSKVSDWRVTVNQDLESMNSDIVESLARIPARVTPLLPWLTQPKETLAERNHKWLEQEREHWQTLFSQVESSPLNQSQQHAVLLNDDHNLILAGAGSGKTSVLSARVAYLLQSHQAQAEDILMLAFGKEAANEMQTRLNDRVGADASRVTCNTFHQLGLSIVRQIETEPVSVSPLATDHSERQAWCIDWLKKHWMTPTNFKRWQKHLNQWPIAYLKGDEELGSHVENPKLIAWLDNQVQQLAALGENKKQIQEKIIDHAEYTRLNSELALSWPCFTAWQKMLKENNELDFPSMIRKATEYVVKGKFHSPWRFVMVDEYQDISPERLALIEALCDSQQKQNASLFAVGDDWQAIFQFAGSDVDLTTGFQQRFDHSTVHHLDTTYRFNNKIGEVANAFIQQNPSQLSKTLNSFKQIKQQSVVTIPQNSVEKVLDDLNRKAKTTKSVLLLGRNHYHQPDLYAHWKCSFKQLDLEFKTCHASKGQEADYVIILNVDEGQFPTKQKHFHLKDALTRSNETFPDAEERRLFYVALTRAKEKVWIAHNGAGSRFVQELVNGNYPIVKRK